MTFRDILQFLARQQSAAGQAGFGVPQAATGQASPGNVAGLPQQAQYQQALQGLPTTQGPMAQPYGGLPQLGTQPMAMDQGGELGLPTPHTLPQPQTQYDVPGIAGEEVLPGTDPGRRPGRMFNSIKNGAPQRPQTV